MSDSFIQQAYSKWVNGDRESVMTLEDVNEFIRFSEFVDNLIIRNGVKDRAIQERRMYDIISDSMDRLNRKYPHMKLEWVQRPNVVVSAKSIYMLGKMKLIPSWEKDNLIYVPVYYSYDNWKLIDENNIDHELITLLCNSVIHAHRDINCTFINPNNFNKFSFYDLEIIDHPYDSWNVVLVILNEKKELGINLYYTWDAQTGLYRRLDDTSELAQKHNRYVKLIDMLSQ